MLVQQPDQSQPIVATMKWLEEMASFTASEDHRNKLFFPCVRRYLEKRICDSTSMANAPGRVIHCVLESLWSRKAFRLDSVSA